MKFAAPALALFFLFAALSAVAQIQSHATLAIRLRADQPTVSLRGNLRFELLRENVGKRSLLIPRDWAWGIGRTWIRVFDSRGEEVHTDYLADELPPLPRPFDFVLLEPDEFVGIRLEEAATHFFNKPGDYEVVVEYSSYLTEKYARKAMKMPDEPFWGRERSTIKSNSVKVQVTD